MVSLLTLTVFLFHLCDYAPLHAAQVAFALADDCVDSVRVGDTVLPAYIGYIALRHTAQGYALAPDTAP